MAEFASKGVAGTGLGLGIAGTALGLLNGNGNGVLGGLLGGGNNTDQKISTLEAMLAQEKAERYTDQKVLSSVKEIFDEFRAGDAKIAGIVKDTTAALIEVGQGVTRIDKEIECLKTTIAKDQEINALKIDKVKCELGGAIALESERRIAGDQNLYNYVNATFVPGKLIMPMSAICPEPMMRYNNWTAPTGTATTPTSSVIATPETTGK